MDAILKSQVAAFQVELFAAIARLHQHVVGVCAALAEMPKREFVAHVQQRQHELPPKALCFAVFDALKEGKGELSSVRVGCCLH